MNECDFHSYFLGIYEIGRSGVVPEKTAIGPSLFTDTYFQLVPPINVVIGVGIEIALLLKVFPSDPLTAEPQIHKVPSVLIATV